MPDPSNSTGTGLVRLAYAYSPSEVALMISALEGAGFDVFAPGFHMAANAQHLSVALGGVPIMVPASQADEAAALLAAIEADTARNAQTATNDESPDALPAKTPNPLLRALYAVFYLFTGTAPALNQRFLSHKNTVPPQDEQTEQTSRTAAD